MAELSSLVTRQRYGENLVWFGEIERKLAKLSMPTLTYRSSSLLFYAVGGGVKTTEKNTLAQYRLIK